MIEAVTFDLDGTLIDSTDAIVESFMHTCDKFGDPRPPRDAVVNSIGFTLEQQFAQLSQRDPDDCARVYRAHYEKIACDMTTLLPGGREALALLQREGFRLGFATSKLRKYAEMILDHLGVLDYFEVRIGPEDVVNPKPHPEAVLKALAHFNLPPEKMLFIGDMHFDALAARAANVRCLCVATGYATRAELEALEPEAVFDSLDPLIRYILENRASVGTPARVS
ncbi:MAG: HAD-IA family hydrolase [Candidatus Hydrogenedentes bacterium]|nr:HAD-IA family hydrolase [Candidatus Hydrogenedentota bacterium]